MKQACLLARREQDLEALADDLLGGVAQHALDRRALIDDRPARVDNGDEVARVLHERAEPRLARSLEHLLGKGRAFECQGEMCGQRLNGALLAARWRAVWVARHERAARDAVPFEWVDEHAVRRVET